MSEEGIPYLSTSDTKVTQCPCQYSYSAGTPRVRQELKTHRLKRISYQECHIFTILLPDGWFPTTELIIVHARQIIMHECIAVHELDSYECCEEFFSLFCIPESFLHSCTILVCDHSKDRSESLATSLYSISECFFISLFDSCR